MGIDSGGPEYAYEQLASWLRERIDNGTFAPRSAIPSITDLAADHGVALVTARKAVRLLVDEGLLITRIGRGTFVTGSPR